MLTTNTLLTETLEILVDPITKKSLKLSNSVLLKNHIIEGVLIAESGIEYEIHDGLANFIPKREYIGINPKLLDAWDKLQENGALVYDKFPELNCAVKDRKDMAEFKKFCSFYGTVLDVGCGPRIPSYLRDNKNMDLAIGLDPLVLINKQELEDNIDLLRGMGEFLPFRDETFDVICFATSFDHTIEPLTALREVRRVLKKDGTACFWINDDIPKKSTLFERAVRKTRRTLSRESSKIKELSPLQEMENKQIGFVQSLQIPYGAEDQFHLKHIRNSEFDSLCQSVKLQRIEKIGPITINDLFVKYQKSF